MSKVKMTKAEIVESISDSTGMPKKNVHNIIDLMLSQVKDALSEDRIIELRGFGTFEIRTRKGREKARNPKTGQTVKVEDHGVVNFRPGKELKDSAWPLRK